MLKYKFNVGEALERAGLNMYKAKTTKVLSQNTLKKIKNEDTSISFNYLKQGMYHFRYATKRYHHVCGK